MNHIWSVFAGLACLIVPLNAVKADEREYGFTIGSVTITKPISAKTLSLKNMSSSKIASKRDLAVTSNNPVFNVTGQVFCKPGARLTAVQAIIGQGMLHNNDMMVLNPWGKTAKQTKVAGRSDADVSLDVELNVTKRSEDSNVVLTFSPAYEYERKLKAYVAKGGTAAEYLRETQAFDMELTVNLVAWCKMDPKDNSILAGKTYAGFTSRKVPVTILYNGDPAIVDGPAARTTRSTRANDGSPPVKTSPPVD